MLFEVKLGTLLCAFPLLWIVPFATQLRYKAECTPFARQSCMLGSDCGFVAGFLPEISPAVGVAAQAPLVVKAARTSTDKTIKPLNRVEKVVILDINILQF